MRLVLSFVPVLSALVLSACGGEWKAGDGDGDDWSVAEGDCWDQSEGPPGSGLSGSDIHPGAEETWYDGFDQDCGGDDDYDADGDGWVPDAAYLGLATYGVDGSGEHLGAGDCIDSPDASVGVLNGFPALGPADVNPGASTDTWYDGVDQDCAGDDDFDRDADGFGTAAWPDASGVTGEDCDDDDAAVNPEAVEVCDDIDNDCNDLVDADDPDVDESTTTVVYADSDGDGFGDPLVPLETCGSAPGYVDDDTDCDDGDPRVNPEADEVCDEGDVDEDCDGTADDGDDSVVYGADDRWHTDDDGDGYGSSVASVQACEQPAGTLADGSDCDDSDSDVNPGATETCNGKDDDCDTDVDDDDSGVVYDSNDVWYDDGDSDGFGDPATRTEACDPPTGSVADGTDCDDGQPDVNPDAVEVCNSVDDDCDTDVDDDDADLDTSTAGTWYADGDGDTFGDPATSTVACDPPTGTVADDTDCDDTDADVNTDATEVCDSVDNDCDTLVDDDDGSIDTSSQTRWYTDADSDGYGDSSSSVLLCTRPTGTVRNSTDCDDSDSAVNPGEDEVCNDGLDNDCDGTAGTTSSGGACEMTDQSAGDADLRLTGVTSSSTAGQAVLLSGDLTGDGYDDIAMGAPYNSQAGSGFGVVYLVEGSATVATPGGMDSESLATADVSLSGPSSGAHAGWGLGEGDFDGDGVDDLVIGAPHVGGTDAGVSYLFHGPVTTSASVTTADATWTGATSKAYGGSAFSTGDTDDDGLDDLLIAASGYVYASGGTAVSGNKGQAVLLGSATIASGTPPATGDATLTGATVDDGAGFSVLLADVDGDGLAEVLAGAPEAGTSSSNKPGYAYVVDDGPSGSVLWSSGATIQGAANADRFGYAIAGFDANGDGTDDLAVGADQESTGASNAGAVYVWNGALATSGTRAASTATGMRTGAASGDKAGCSLASAGDVDGDGNDDLLVGACKESTAASQAGAVYLLFGPLSGTSSLSGADAAYTGEVSKDNLGYAVSAGDANGDGASDLLLGAPYYDVGVTTSSGAGYLFLGLGL